MNTHLVVYIGDVHNKVDLVSKIILKNASNDICRHIVSSMSQMRVIVDSWSARIPRDLAWLDGHKRHWWPRLKGIMDFEGIHYAALTIISKVWGIICLRRSEDSR
jgi:hypothetical protein